MGFNLGNGSGYSVLDIINVCSDVAGCEVEYEIAPRRVGDPPSLVADSCAALNKLGWKPKMETLTEIITSAWLWHKMDSAR